MDGVRGPALHMGVSEEGLYLHLGGVATVIVCTSADEVVRSFVDVEPKEPVVTVDLEGASWVDSTCAGWLLGWSRRLKEAGGRLIVTGCGAGCRASLDKTRCGELLDFAAATPPENLREVLCTLRLPPDRAELTVMVAAHRELADVDEQNSSAFTPIAEMLAQQLQALHSKAPPQKPRSVVF